VNKNSVFSFYFLSLFVPSSCQCQDADVPIFMLSFAEQGMPRLFAVNLQTVTENSGSEECT
jgi:hypothetical protein